MDQLAGWATCDAVDDDSAHQVEQVGKDPSGQPVYGSLCGQFTSPLGWTVAGPEVTRCAVCQDRAAGTPD